MKKTGIIYPLSGSSFYGSVLIFEETIGFTESTKRRKLEGIVSVTANKAKSVIPDTYGVYRKQSRPSFSTVSIASDKNENLRQESDSWYKRLETYSTKKSEVEKVDKSNDSKKSFSESVSIRNEKIENKGIEKNAFEVRKQYVVDKDRQKDGDKDKGREDRLVNVLFIFEIVNWFRDLDVVGKFIIGLIAGVIAFFLIFSQLGFMSLLNSLR